MLEKIMIILTRDHFIRIPLSGILIKSISLRPPCLCGEIIAGKNCGEIIIEHH